MLGKWLGLGEPGVTVKGEFAAGLTTFLTMAYILVVNPSILGEAITLESQGFAQLLSATALAAAVGCILMAFLARYPYAVAPGMGLNAYFAYTVVLGEQIPWTAALGAVFISGVVFLLLSLVGVRRAVVQAIPTELRGATAAGIGAFLALIGLQNAGLVVDHPATLLTLGAPTSAGPLIALGGLVVTAALMALRVPGAILIGILAATVAAIGTDAPVFGGQPWAGFEDGWVATPVWPTELVGALDIGAALDLGLLGIVFTFLFVDLFDTAGTLMGLARQAGHLDEAGDLPRASRAFSADAAATAIGGWLGTSTATSYIESAAGIATGGRTGLTALTVGVLFLASLFLWPLFAAVPVVATAPALVVVGAMMMQGMGSVRWDDARSGLPAFLTLVGIPFTFSIATGISLGIVSWVAIFALSGRWREVHPILALLAVLLVFRFAWLAAA